MPAWPQCELVRVDRQRAARGSYRQSSGQSEGGRSTQRDWQGYIPPGSRSAYLLVMAKSTGASGSVGVRIDELRTQLHRANAAYYGQATPMMADAEFDRALAELAKLEAANPEFADANSPTQRVGGEPIEGFVTRTHALPMLSIDNTYNAQDVRAWWQRTADALGAATFVAMADPKIDGLALSLRYERGTLAYAVTRGDGTKGDDVTHTVRTIESVPLVLLSEAPVPEVLEVRGEVYFPLAEFARTNAERTASGEEAFMNPRNAAAGTLKQLDPAAARQRRLAFFAHGKGEVSGKVAGGFVRGYGEYLAMLSKLGFATSPHAKRCESADAVLQVIENFDKARHGLSYATDGMVVRVDDFAQQAKLGLTSKSPRWAIAYKFPAERTTTTLLKVDHQVGKSGKITPRAGMAPVLIAGSVVQHATLHNYGRLRSAPLDPDAPDGPSSHLCIGDTVFVEKAGEVIPYVAGVDVSKRPKGATPIKAPSECPACGSAVLVEPPEAVDDPRKETQRHCPNPACPAQAREKLIWFAGRKQMDIDGLGEKTIDQIRASAVPLNTFADVFRLAQHRDALRELDRMGDKKTENLLAGIEAAKDRGLGKLLAGMGISHVGESTSKALGRMFSDVAALLAASEPMLRPKACNPQEAAALGLDKDPKQREETGLGRDTAPVVHAYLQRPETRAMFAELAALGVSMSSANYRPAETKSQRTAGSNGKSASKESVFSGQTVVITGTLERFERTELADLLTELGAKVSGSVSAKTNILICGEKAGSKLDKARELGVRVMLEPELRAALSMT